MAQIKKGGKAEPARTAAIAAGSPTYITGRPCRHGHLSPRFVSNGCCVECMRTRHKIETAKKREARQEREKLAALAVKPVNCFADLMAVWGLPEKPVEIDVPARVIVCWDLPESEAV